MPLNNVLESPAIPLFAERNSAGEETGTGGQTKTFLEGEDLSQSDQPWSEDSDLADNEETYI